MKRDTRMTVNVIIELFLIKPIEIKINPTINDANPHGENILKDTHNWLSKGFRRIKSNIPFCTCLIILLRLGCKKVIVKPSNNVYIPITINDEGQFHPPKSWCGPKNNDNVNRLPNKLPRTDKISTNRLSLYSSSMAILDAQNTESTLNIK